MENIVFECNRTDDKIYIFNVLLFSKITLYKINAKMGGMSTKFLVKLILQISNLQRFHEVLKCFLIKQKFLCEITI